MAEPEEQNLPADGQSLALQTTAPSKVLRGASPYSAGADEVCTHKKKTWITKKKWIVFEEVVTENISSLFMSRDIFKLPFQYSEKKNSEERQLSICAYANFV